VRRADGTERWIRDQAFPLRDAEGRVTRAAGIARDVSLRKEVEGRLRISDTRCTGLIDALGTLTWWSDAEGQVVEQRGAPVDAAALPRYPASAEESWLAWLSGPSRAALDAAWQQARAEQCGFHAVIEVAWPNAAPRHHLCRAAPIRMGDDGPVHEWAGVLLDLERPPEVATTDATNCGGREPVSVPPA
jgi:PAS domain-containing protein